MIITTESGTQHVVERGRWSVIKNGTPSLRGFNTCSEWLLEEPFCFVQEEGMTTDDVLALPEEKRLPLTVGLRAVFSGKDSWRISTRIVSIEGE